MQTSRRLFWGEVLPGSSHRHPPVSLKSGITEIVRILSPKAVGVREDHRSGGGKVLGRIFLAARHVKDGDYKLQQDLAPACRDLRAARGHGADDDDQQPVQWLALRRCLARQVPEGNAGWRRRAQRAWSNTPARTRSRP